MCIRDSHYTLHLVCISHEVTDQITTVKLHTLNNTDVGITALALLESCLLYTSAHRGICKERPQADGCGKAGDAERGGSIPEIVS